ncbi:MAG: phage tail assembly chaperone [Beijerinckiaceae bacterium]|nr:phage tail assembly chaperone [Beijerinckiaceae bacterium]
MGKPKSAGSQSGGKLVEQAFKAACRPKKLGGLGLKPPEFWALHPRELWWLFEAARPPKMYGSMSASEVEEIYRETYGEPEGLR